MSPLTTDSTHHSESDWESAVHTTIKFCEKTTELSTHQSHEEENLEAPKLDVHNGTTTVTVSTTSTSNAGILEQCNGEADTGLCLTASDCNCSNYCPTNLQEPSVDRDENTWEPDILDNGSTLGNPIPHSDGHKDVVNNDTIEIVNL
jgi:hypothetical protein